jgi:6-phosphogluconate dehydrogenase
MVGLGRMGSNLSRRLMHRGHEVVAYDVRQDAVRQLEGEGAIRTASLEDFASKLSKPRVAWLMVPAAFVESTADRLAELMDPGDVIIDGGNSYYREDVERAERYRAKDIAFIDVGTSGGVFGFERGFCLMIGGDEAVVRRLDPIFAALAPGVEGRLAADEHCRGRLPVLRTVRRRPFRQDGPQRDRVRPHGRLRRGPERDPPR